MNIFRFLKGTSEPEKEVVLRGKKEVELPNVPEGVDAVRRGIESLVDPESDGRIEVGVIVKAAGESEKTGGDWPVHIVLEIGGEAIYVDVPQDKLADIEPELQRSFRLGNSADETWWRVFRGLSQQSFRRYWPLTRNAAGKIELPDVLQAFEIHRGPVQASYNL